MKLIIKLALSAVLIGIVHLWSWLSGQPAYEVAAFFALGGVVALTVWREETKGE